MTLACLAAVVGFAAAAHAQPGAPGQPAVRQTNATAPAPAQPMSAGALPGTRVAVVNINKVLKNYQKAQRLNEAIRQKVSAYAKMMNDKRELANKLQAEVAKPNITPQQKEQIDKQLLNLQRELQ